MGDISFGAWLKIFRTAQIGLRDYARLLHMDSGNYSKIETGKIAPPNSAKKIKKLVKKLNLTENDILTLKIAAYRFHKQRLKTNIFREKTPKGGE